MVVLGACRFQGAAHQHHLSDFETAAGNRFDPAAPGQSGRLAQAGEGQVRRKRPAFPLPTETADRGLDLVPQLSQPPVRIDEADPQDAGTLNVGKRSGRSQLEIERGRGRGDPVPRRRPRRPPGLGGPPLVAGAGEAGSAGGRGRAGGYPLPAPRQPLRPGEGGACAEARRHEGSDRCLARTPQYGEVVSAYDEGEPVLTPVCTNGGRCRNG